MTMLTTCCSQYCLLTKEYLVKQCHQTSKLLLYLPVPGFVSCRIYARGYQAEHYVAYPY